MPTFSFHCDRGVPGTSSVPMLAALGAACLGFEVTYGRTDPSGPPAASDDMMPDFLAGVDVVRQPPGRAPAGPSAPHDRRASEGYGDPRVLRVVDAPLPGPGVERGNDRGTVDCLVAGSTALSLLGRDPAPIRLAYDAISRNGMRRSWDAASSSWRLDVPALTTAELASLLRGAPMPRPMAIAGELARAILCSAPAPHVPSPTYAWPAASRRAVQARVRALPAPTAR